MTDREIQMLVDMVEEKIARGVTAEEATATFIAAGILDKDGNYTAPFMELIKEDFPDWF